MNNKEKWSKRNKKILSIVMAVMVAGGYTLWAMESTKAYAAGDPEEATETEEAINKSYPQLLKSGSTDGKITKEETAYVIMDADGEVTDTVITEWLRNGTAAEEINDVSNLEDIENTANDNGFTRNVDDLTWEAGGSDIKYRGSATKQIPVDVKVSYILDGTPMSASEIAGKAGNVEIRFTYTVHTSSYTDGYEFITPYTMASGVMLSDEHFTDVRVSQGKVVDDGSNAVCLGLAFPGMNENLGIDADDLDIPESVSITAYTDCFEIGGTYTVALTGIMSDLDLTDTGSITDKIDSLEKALKEMGDAADKLVSGADQVADGAAELDSNAEDLKDGASSVANGSRSVSQGASAVASGSSELADGTEQAKQGASQLADGTGQLKSGADDLADGSEQLKSGSESLASGLDELSAGSQNLQAGVEAYVAGAEQLASGIDSVKSGADTVLAGEQAVNAGLKQLSDSGDSIDSSTDAIVSAMKGVIESNSNLSDDQKAQLKAQIEGYASEVKSYTGSVSGLYSKESELLAGVESLQSGASDLKYGSDALVSQSDALTQGAAQVAGGAQQSSAGANSLKDGASNLNTGASSLKDGASSVDDGAKALADGAESLNEGANSLKSGANSLASGSKELSDGASKLANGTEKFKDGTSALSDGAAELADGMSAFNEKGIKKLISTLDDADIDGMVRRLEALADASSDSGMVGGIAAGMDGESKIIFRTDAVKA